MKEFSVYRLLRRQSGIKEYKIEPRKSYRWLNGTDVDRKATMDVLCKLWPGLCKG